MKFNFYLLGSVLIAALGGLLFGFDTIVIQGTTDQLKKVFELNDFWLGFTVASALIGTVVGSIAAGRPSDAWGRRGVLMAIAVIYFVTAIGCALPLNWYWLLFFRFMGGIAIGGASVVSPMYIAEISPAASRGARRFAAVQRRLRRLIGRPLELCYPSGEPGRERLALDARRGGRSLGDLSVPPVSDTTVATVVDRKRTGRRGPTGAPPLGHRHRHS